MKKSAERRVWKIAILGLLSVFMGFGLQAQTTKTIEVGPFSTISLNSEYKVTLRQSNKQEVTIKADPEIVATTTVWADNGTLHIDVKSNDASKKNQLNKLANKLTQTMEITITVIDLKKVIVNSGGSVTAENSINSPVLDLEVNGSGSITLDSRATTVNASINSTGSITLSGYGTSLNLNAGGEGTFNGLNFDVKKAKADVRGMKTSCKLNVSESLNITVFGNAEVYYKGNVKDITKFVYGEGFVLFRN